MNKAEKIMKKKGAIKAEMDKLMPKPRSDEVWREAADKLSDILQRYADLPRGVRFHTDSRIFPSAAIYLTAKSAVGREKAYMMIENAAIAGCEPIGRKLVKLMKRPGMRSFFIKAWAPLTRIIFGPGNGFRNVFYPKRKNEFRMDITACPYCRYFGELGCPELTGIFCDNDERIYGNLPGLVFERTGTLGKGASRCDFLIRKM